MTKPKLPDAETIRRALKNIEALFADPEALDRVHAQLAAIDEEADQRKRAVLDAAGLPSALAEQVTAGAGVKLPLTPKEPYATIPTMSTTFVPIPRKTGRPLGTGPVAEVAKRLGLSMDGVAKAIRVNRNTVKTWNARGEIPDDAQVKIDALLAKAKATRGALK